MIQDWANDKSLANQCFSSGLELGLSSSSIAWLLSLKEETEIVSDGNFSWRAMVNNKSLPGTKAKNKTEMGKETKIGNRKNSVP